MYNGSGPEGLGLASPGAPGLYGADGGDGWVDAIPDGEIGEVLEVSQRLLGEASQVRCCATL